MPVRIYDIAKKLGLESKEVISKAKALGITAAKVPSSSLDKITAEYLEEQLGGKPAAVAEPAPAAAPQAPVMIIAPPPPPPPPPEPEPVAEPAPEPVYEEAAPSAEVSPEPAAEPISEPEPP